MSADLTGSVTPREVRLPAPQAALLLQLRAETEAAQARYALACSVALAGFGVTRSVQVTGIRADGVLTFTGGADA